MSSLLYRLGRATARGRALVLAAWIALLALSGGAAMLLGQGTDDTFAIPGSESQETLDYLGHVFPEMSGAQAQLVAVVPEGERVDTPANREAVEAAVAEIEEVPDVALVANPFDEDVHDAVSPDGRAALIAVPLDVAIEDVSDRTRSDIAAIAEELRADIGAGAEVHTGGKAFEELVPEFSIVEIIGVGVALVVLLVLFKSFLAAGMPLITALIGVGVSVSLIMAVTVLTPISSTAPMLAVMLGLAVGIDYALFILSRHRDQLAEGIEVEESIARAVATAGSAVLFAGVTVMIALLALFVAGIPFLTTMGIAAAGAVMIAVLVAVTLLPALMAFAGRRLRPRTPRRARDGRRRTARAGLAAKWVRGVTRAPVVTIVVLVAGLGLIALPGGSLQLALPNGGSEEEGAPARDAYDALTEHFGPGYNGPLLVVADIIGSHDPVGVVDGIAEDIEELDGVQTVPLATPNRDADTGVIQVVPSSGPDSAETKQLVQTLRDHEEHFAEVYGVSTSVTGLTAIAIDVSDQLGDALLPFGGIVVGLSLLLLAMVFRSIWVPIKASVGYLLSVGAAFGATALVFQHGHFAELLNVTETGSVISFLPIMLMGILFGLAMDYQVFLVSRIREDYVHGGDPHRAIETGFVSASRVVVAAAVIMFAVFAAFVPEGMATLKPIAFSLAVGVFVDAFLVRMTLVPAILSLLGERAWGLPPRLDRKLPAFDAEGGALEHELQLADWPAPDSAEVVSARELSLTDDRGRVVFSGVETHLFPGGLLGVHGSGPSGKSALLYAIGGRVPGIDGDLKVLGRVVPQHARAVRTRVALIACRDTDTPADEARSALSDGVSLLLFDDLDAVVNTGQRDTLRTLLARPITPDGTPAGVVFTCQDPNLLVDILPPTRLSTIDLSRRLVEVP
ncbi:putative drug exporter of the RND superfamily [Haloechinothrix alba]|uniref:Putative drug exporter of the RND superfamily n=1 Tax=Haloechinothrix alba TaxID=664784 RepID=A0A238W7W3_9PSEU|nr:MMPL family transporter [Haloechinothrix alba]SNR41779.1 putative drug exporter of the RND superfamily [Haloechinothrix alba]